MREIGNLKQGTALSQNCRLVSGVHKEHGCLEKKPILVSTDLNEYLDWPEVGQVFRLECKVWHEKG
ncbi:hypothetical protein BECAL_00828 [Bellilinea caldifistulae]|nr:hypothetical protein BECAL_00828 [Bellilinea caldifistulae]